MKGFLLTCCCCSCSRYHRCRRRCTVAHVAKLISSTQDPPGQRSVEVGERLGAHKPVSDCQARVESNLEEEQIRISGNVNDRINTDVPHFGYHDRETGNGNDFVFARSNPRNGEIDIVLGVRHFQRYTGSELIARLDHQLESYRVIEKCIVERLEAFNHQAVRSVAFAARAFFGKLFRVDKVASRRGRRRRILLSGESSNRCRTRRRSCSGENGEKHNSKPHHLLCWSWTFGLMLAPSRSLGLLLSACACPVRCVGWCRQARKIHSCAMKRARETWGQRFPGRSRKKIR